MNTNKQTLNEMLSTVTKTLSSRPTIKSRKLTRAELRERVSNIKKAKSISNKSKWDNNTIKRRAKNKVAKQSRKINRL